jgi:hypothetical protein
MVRTCYKYSFHEPSDSGWASVFMDALKQDPIARTGHRQLEK